MSSTKPRQESLLILAMRYADPKSKESIKADRDSRLPEWIKELKRKAP